jgi:hypothetical protein
MGTQDLAPEDRAAQCLSGAAPALTHHHTTGWALGAVAAGLIAGGLLVNAALDRNHPDARGGEPPRGRP